MPPLKFITRQQLDTPAWDNCIQQAPNGLPYTYSWYLDIVCQGNWSALVRGDYRAVMPLPFNKKLFGFPQLYQPILSQQLGVFGQVSSEGIHTFLREANQHYRRINLNFNATNYSELKDPSIGSLIAKTNLLLRLNRSYEVIHAGYSKSLRKRLRKTETWLPHPTTDQAGQACRPTKDATTLIELYQKQIGNRLNWPGENYRIVAKLIDAAIEREAGVIRQVVDENGEVQAIGFFLIGCGRVINLFGASTSNGRKIYAMHRLLDEVIREFHQQADYFDFEGSELPGVAEFFRSFGALEEQYGYYHSERLPIWLKLALKAKAFIRT